VAKFGIIKCQENSVDTGFIDWVTQDKSKLFVWQTTCNEILAVVRNRRFILTKIYRVVVIFGGLCTLRAADEQQLALALRAQTDFERVQQTSGLALPDATRCEQSEAAWLTVAPPADLSLAHFRKGYCALAMAVITHRSDDFRKAADEFEQAVKAWPEHTVKPGKNRVPEPTPVSLRLLAPIARLQAASLAPGGAAADAAELDRARGEISAARDRPACSAAVLPVAACDALLNTGRLWLGWMALHEDDLDRAAREFSGLTEFGWPQWTAGRRAFHDRQYAEAAMQYGQAVEIWNRPVVPTSPLAVLLAPSPDRAQALTDWGGAQLLSGNTAAAVSTLDAAVKASANPARPLFLRARAEELAGRQEPALADYSLASRTALAHAEDLASGEAHLYRGILLYRRKDFEHAENEFASALNFDIPASMRPDAIAWRYMATVAEGGCTSSRAPLEQSLAEVSPYFPKSEARTLAATCPLTGSAISAGAI
jgi:tetratricopeptide (TPR) repeat protein